MSLESVLTTAQRTAVKDRGGQPDGRGDGRGRGDGPPRDGRPPGGRPAGGRPAGGGDFGPPPDGGRPPKRDGGPPRGGGFDPARFQAMRSVMDTMNPFYPPTKYSQLKGLPDRMKQGMNRRYTESRATVTALARKAK